MADDIMKFLGLDGTAPDRHPDEDILSDLGLKPSVGAPVPRSEGLGPPQPGPVRYPAPPARSTLQRIHETIDPSVVIPRWASRTGEAIKKNALASSGVVSQGIDDITQGRPATGTGRIVLGTAGVGLSPLTGAVETTVEEPLRELTGNPDFASKAALMFPVNVGGPAVRTAAHNIHPTTRAADFVAQKAGPENIPAMLERLRSNPRLRPIDTNDQLRMSGQGLVASADSPEASRILTENMRASAAGARDAVKGTYDAAMGKPPNLYEEYQRLEKAAQTVGRTKIDPPLKAAGPIDMSKVIEDIDAKLKPGVHAVIPGQPPFQTPLQAELRAWKSELHDGSSMLTDANRLHEVQSDLRRYAEELMMSPNGPDKRLGRQLMNVRNQMVDAIDAGAKGYKQGLADFKDAKDIQAAFDFGREMLKNGTDLKHDPSFVEQWVKHKGRSPEELEAARLGARQAVEQKMGSIKQSALDPARSGTDVPQIEFNKQKLEHLFGKERTDQMFRHLQDERDIALTNNRGLGNSKTAETQAAERELRPREISKPHSNLPGWALTLGGGVGAFTGNPTLGAMAGGGLLAARGGKSMYDWLARRGELSRNRSVADIITRNDPETQALLSIAAQRVGQRNKLSNLIAPP